MVFISKTVKNVFAQYVYLSATTKVNHKKEYIYNQIRIISACSPRGFWVQISTLYLVDFLYIDQNVSSPSYLI